MEFIDRLLTCSDCHGDFVFTAGEQLFFHDKQFKNDPKRCKPCKSKRATPGASTGPAAAGISRTETRTECSECGIETTVPFKPTQGRPVLCRMCFQKHKSAPAPIPVAALPPSMPVITESSLLAAQAAAANDLPMPEISLQTASAQPRPEASNGVALLASVSQTETQPTEGQIPVAELAQA